MAVTLQDDMQSLIALSSDPCCHGFFTKGISRSSRETFLDRTLSIWTVSILKVPLQSLCIRTYVLLLSCVPQCLSMLVIV